MADKMMDGRCGDQSRCCVSGVIREKPEEGGVMAATHTNTWGDKQGTRNTKRKHRKYKGQH